MTKFISEEFNFLVSPRFSAFPISNIDTLLNSTTPSIKNLNLVKGSGSVVTITNFVDGIEGHFLRILGDGNMTISNNANIKTNTAANKLLAANKIYNFTLLSNVWYEGA